MMRELTPAFLMAGNVSGMNQQMDQMRRNVVPGGVVFIFNYHLSIPEYLLWLTHFSVILLTGFPRG